MRAASAAAALALALLFATAAPAMAVGPPVPAEAAEVEGQVLSRRGAPVAEAQLVLLRRGSDGSEAPVEATDTDRLGRFRIPPVPRGAYVLDVRAPGFGALRYAFEVGAPVEGLALRLDPLDDASAHVAFVYAPQALPGRDGTSTATVTRGGIDAMPGGTTRALNDVLATQPGFTRDDQGAVHVRGNFAGLQLRVDGVTLPPSAQTHLQQLLDAQIVDRAEVILGGLPAEFGENVAGVIDIQTRRPGPKPYAEAQVLYGTYGTLRWQEAGDFRAGPFSIMAAGSAGTTARGLDPPAASPILHDRLHDGHAFLRIEERLGGGDRLQLLGAYGQTHYQIPIDPTLSPLSAAPPGAVRAPDQYGNQPPDFVPFDADPTESELDLFAALTWFHDFGPRAALQVSPFVRDETSTLTCDTARQLGPTADPGQTCSDVTHRVLHAGGAVNQTIALGRHELKTGVWIDAQRNHVDYSAYVRHDASAAGGPDPAATVAGADKVSIALAAVYAQDRIALGKLTLLPGVRLDWQRAAFDGATGDLWGPSVRLGASYLVSPRILAHAFGGYLWQPPTYDAPAAARVLGLVAPGQPIAAQLYAEDDAYAEVGLGADLVRALRVTATAWGRLSWHTLDDAEVGDTALTADYNYLRGRAAGLELGAVWTVLRRLHGFANATFELSQGTGIASAAYLFTPAQLAYTGHQATDNAQRVIANGGFDLADLAARTHLDALVTFGSGLRTGPVNAATLPAAAIVDLTLRHRFELPLRPELAIDVRNLFDVVYAYRIATGSLSGSAYGPLRTVDVRLILPFGS
ncbi:MAG TPA: TonB-dependent receptor [Polyangia bacterium]|nr:TonB-dependent receptor [Polyangia bacterium]